ncbi:hypothetical protein [Marinobacterium sedimentorum]|uniref:hypothetical protein n=1 Tax=Marinobacterium sedimentorum TaxID=2927804 RepID=UPI0020C6966C|nr:hypothetical protein [Marinobacterium sedimentorum]MCP8687724.1 hypothetical protein [Marinobacterium sedimentorum]
MANALAQRAFDHNLRAETIIHIGAMCTSVPMADIATEAFQEDWDELWNALGVTRTPHDVDDESICSALMHAGRRGFLIQIGTPVPQGFTEDGSYVWSWGHYQLKWFYGDSVEGAFEAAAQWQEKYIEAKHAKEQSKEATSC